jgi:nucleotide-binding universal stress UspA family protein
VCGPGERSRITKQDAVVAVCPHGEERPMRPIRRILFPTDFSEYAEDAWPYATRFAADFAAELHLLHVVSPPPPFVCTEGMMYDPKDMEENRVADAEAALRPLVGTAKDLGLTARWHVGTGVPFHEILEYARRHDVDLIVMATHGRTGLAHALLGSVTEKVVRQAPCPVLTVRHPAMRTRVASGLGGGMTRA